MIHVWQGKTMENHGKYVQINKKSLNPLDI
jgi:hypothetical protein